MSVKFELEKDGYVKDGFAGFSYTTFFFNFFVPIFRGDLKGFLVLFGLYLFPQAPFFWLNFILEKNENAVDDFIERINPFLNTLDKEDPIKIITIGFMIIALFSTISLAFGIFLGFWYNKIYTKSLLKKGYKPFNNNLYSNFVLKYYGYLNYTEEDLEHQEEYQEIAFKIKKSEKRKFYVFMIYFIFIFLLFIFMYFMLFILIRKYQ